MHFSSELSYTPFSVTKSMKLFFLGISGTLMGNLALMAKELGHDVMGVDSKIYPPMSEQLEGAKIRYLEGFTKENFRESDIYIVGNVISRGNELLEFILESQRKIQSGPAWLYNNILKNREVIAISGTHGKTTVTSMVVHGLKELGIEPGYLIAGVPGGDMNSYSLGSNNLFVIEADEYDTCYFDKNPKFLHYDPKYLLVNNLEFDHADIFNNLEDIEGKFLELLQKMNSKSKAIINKDGIREKFYDDLVSSKFDCSTKFLDIKNKDFAETNKILAGSLLEAIGKNNLNTDVFKNFRGVRRRFETVFQNSQFTIIDDFGHHPTAIEKVAMKAEKDFDDLVLIVEFASNTMKSGLHDKKLKKIFSNRKTFLINASSEQTNLFNNSVILSKTNLSEVLNKKESDHLAILMCSNKQFMGIQNDLISFISSQSDE